MSDFYNRASAHKMGWDPSWFGADEFDEELAEKIKDFQRKMGIEPDGLCGPQTFARISTEREAGYELIMDKLGAHAKTASTKYFIANGKKVPIEWDNFVSLNDSDNLALPGNCYRWETKRQPTMIVTHWDAALSAESCKNILERKGISSHFIIDNDGTIYQMVDTSSVCWHAGIRKVNARSIGIDFSNAFYTKYQGHYVRKGFGERPILSGSRLHGGKVEEHLGYYPVQIEAYKALVKALADHYPIALAYPSEAGSEELLLGVDKDAAAANFSGVVCHYHLTRRKIDCAGLELDKIIKEVRSED